MKDTRDMLDVRRPEVDDAPGIFECLKAYNLHTLGESLSADPDTSSDAIIQVRNALSHIDLAEKSWIALEQDQILGFCCWDWLEPAQQIAKTVLISVVTRARSLGVGTLLQRRRLDEMREQGAQEAHTWSDEPGAVQWYQKTFGYSVLDQEPTRHCLHRFHFRGQHLAWAIHRGVKDRDTLIHLRLGL